MEADTAAIWVKNRLCEQMIKIHDHRRYHEKVGFLPMPTKKCCSNHSWHCKMKE